MRQTNAELTQTLAERLCWEVARQDDRRVARRLYRKQEVDGVYRLDEGAVLDDFFHFLQALGMMALLEEVHGVVIQREMVPSVQYVLLYGLKTLFGIESMNALPALLFSDEALMQLVGFNAQHVHQGMCQRGAATRQGERTPGPISPETLAKNIVKLNLRDLERVFNGAIRALAKAGVFAKQVTGIADGTDLETTARYRGCGQVTRKVRIEDTQGRRREIEATVYGWKVLLLIEAVSKIPLAVKVGKIQEHETHWTRALVTQARANLAGHAHQHKVVFDRGFLDGTDLWWRDQHGLSFVVPAKTHMAVTADARAQAAAGEEVTVGRRAHTGRHGQGKTARTERREPEVVGSTGLTTDDQYGTPEHARHANRPDFQPHPINGVVVRQWNGKDYGPGGKTVFLTNGPVEKPLQVFDDYDDRSLIENCSIKACKQPWDLGHPPQKKPSGRSRCMSCSRCCCSRWPRRIGCRVSAKPWGRSPSAGNAGGASSWSRPGTRASCLPKVMRASFIWLRTPCYWVSSSKMSRQVSAPVRKSSPSISSQCRANLMSESQTTLSWHAIRQVLPTSPLQSPGS